MELDVLAHRKVGGTAAVFLADAGDRAELMRLEQAIGNSNPDHEVRDRLPFPALAARNAYSITLGVDAPPAEIRPDPLGRNGLKSLACEAADVLQSFPWVLFALQALD